MLGMLHYQLKFTVSCVSTNGSNHGRPTNCVCILVKDTNVIILTGMREIKYRNKKRFKRTFLWECIDTIPYSDNTDFIMLAIVALKPTRGSRLHDCFNVTRLAAVVSDPPAAKVGTVEQCKLLLRNVSILRNSS